ncbi:MAG: hypothetical protein IBJ15_16565, partial [Alphaproteobacteria bacterium]|nr:hypothetical protein [Alphaproteobacteria bacterium]
PNGFARGLTRTEFAALNENIDRPLFNRALRGTYPPGSTIKPIMALAGLTHGVVTPNIGMPMPGLAARASGPANLTMPATARAALAMTRSLIGFNPAISTTEYIIAISVGPT